MKKELNRAVVAAVLALAGALPASAMATHCESVGGTILTNTGVIDEVTTLGIYTGDLAGAVSARILSQQPGPDGTILVTVQHYQVTSTGDTVLYAPATLSGREVKPGRVAVLDYPARIIGGTGKFKNAKGELNTIGEVDFGLGQASMRYRGRICYAN